MRASMLTVLFVIAGAFCLGGCGSSKDIGPAPETGYAGLDSAEDIKARLDKVIAEGDVGTHTQGMYEGIEELDIDDAKKLELQTDLGNLDNATDPKKVKEIATQMKSKL